MNETTIRTRFAPSPTGTPESVHLGFVIRALWNYAFAKKNNGRFVLRIEDTDKKRSRKDTEDQIFSVLKEFGITWDEGPDVGGPHGPYRQSERLDKYLAAAKQLVERGFAYYDFNAVVREKDEIKESYLSKEKLEELKQRPKARFDDPVEAKRRVDAGEPYVVRVKIPEDKVFEYHDWILKKKIRVLGKEVPDLILFKSDGYPTYHLAVVVDDIDMEISHVFRGQEWIISTPIHLFLYEGFNRPIPEIGHFTVILDPSTNKKFSKRDMTAKFGVGHWIQQGYLHEAILNYLMLLGWAPKDNREIFSLEDFVQAFDQQGVQKSNPIFNPDKLKWFNGQYLRQKSDEELLELVRPYLTEVIDEKLLIQIIPLAKSRISTLAEFETLVRFFWTRPEKQEQTNGTKEYLSDVLSVLERVDWNKEAIEVGLVSSANAKGWNRGEYFMTLRLAVAGSKVTPPLTESMIIIGKDEILARIKQNLT